jgi:transposase
MQSISTIGLDIAKSVFQVHGVDAAGQVVLRRQLRSRHVLAFFQKLPRCLVGIEAYASSHHWSREPGTLGHTVRLMPPAYVKPNVKRQKNCLMLHRARHLFIRQQTAVIKQLLKVVADPADLRLSEVARACLAALGSQLRHLKAQIVGVDRHIIAWHRSSATSRRLDAIPGVGPGLATALVASIADPKVFRSGRDFSAWVGLVPKQNSSGGKDKLGSISKQGDRYLRSPFTAGALAVIRYAKIHGTGHRPWLWPIDRPKLLRLRSPTRLHAWRGP